MPIQDLSLEAFVGSNPLVKEHGEFEESNLALYDSFFQNWSGVVVVVLEEKEDNGWIYGVVNVPKWHSDAILIARRKNMPTWAVAGAYWNRGLAIRPDHQQKGLSYFLIKEAFCIQGGLRPPDQRVYSRAGLAALKAAHKRACQEPG